MITLKFLSLHSHRMRKMPEKEKAELLSALEKARKRSRSHSSQQSTSTQVGNASTLLTWIDPVMNYYEFASNSPQNDASPSPSPPVIAATAQIHRSSSPGSSAKSQVSDYYKFIKKIEIGASQSYYVLLQFNTKATEYYLDHSNTLTCTGCSLLQSAVPIVSTSQPIVLLWEC